MRAGKLTKSQINNRGYNKYLKLTGEIAVEIDYDKFYADCKWDGLKGYITNTDLSHKEIIDNYNQLWQIEKFFRISKTDLRIRPVYHRLRDRIETYICISFVAYALSGFIVERLSCRRHSPEGIPLELWKIRY
ncbi:hypothetical protein ES705_36102 [subsurface metagenome]